MAPAHESETIVFNFRKLLSTLPNYAELEQILLFSVNWGKQVCHSPIAIKYQLSNEIDINYFPVYLIENNGFRFMSWCHNGIYTPNIYLSYMYLLKMGARVAQ
jgi:hypothetical protein